MPRHTLRRWAATALTGAALTITTTGTLTLTAPSTAAAETPAERCQRETAQWNTAYETAWRAANPGPPPPNPAPYVCVDPAEQTTTTPPPIPTLGPAPTGENNGTGIGVRGGTLGDVGTGEDLVPAAPFDTPSVLPLPAAPPPPAAPPAGDNASNAPIPPARTAEDAVTDTDVEAPPRTAAPSPLPAHQSTNTSESHTLGEPVRDRTPELLLIAAAALGLAARPRTPAHSAHNRYSTQRPGHVWSDLQPGLSPLEARATRPGPGAPWAGQSYEFGWIQPDGDRQRFVLLADRDSDRVHRFDMDVPEGGHMRVNVDGSVDVLDADGTIVNHVKKPWAYDALGRPVDTWYDVDNTTGELIQHIDPHHDSAYPILADPEESVGIVDTTGRSDGETWTESLPNGERLTHTVVEGTGGQTVDTRAARPDGSFSDIRSVSDGQGGWQIWSDNNDGSASYGNKQGADGPITTDRWDQSPVYGDNPTVSSQADSTNSRGTITANNPDGTTSTGDYERTGDNRYGLTTNNPDGTTSNVDSTTNPSGDTHTKVDDVNGSRVAAPDGTITSLDSYGNDTTHGTTPNPGTGRFYDPGTGTWHDGAINPQSGGKTFRLDDGSLLIEHPQENGKSVWSILTADGELGLGENVQVNPDTGEPHLTDPTTGKPLSETLSDGSTAIGFIGSVLERAGKTVPTGRHHLPGQRTVPLESAQRATKYGRLWGGPVSGALEIGSGALAIRDGAPIPETVGRSAGAIGGGYGGALLGASVGAAVGGPVGAVIGAGIGSFAGTAAGQAVGEAAGKAGRAIVGGIKGLFS